MFIKTDYFGIKLGRFCWADFYFTKVMYFLFWNKDNFPNLPVNFSLKVYYKKLIFNNLCSQIHL